MHVVRHEKEELDPPTQGRVVVDGRLQELLPDIRSAELVPVPRRATEGDKIE
jgi:hypothetical protein